MDMKHFSWVLAYSHLLDRLAHCIDAFPTAMQPSVCQRVHIGEQPGLCCESQVRVVGEASAMEVLNGASDIRFPCFAAGIGTFSRENEKG